MGASSALVALKLTSSTARRDPADAGLALTVRLTRHSPTRFPRPRRTTRLSQTRCRSLGDGAVRRHRSFHARYQSASAAPPAVVCIAPQELRSTPSTRTPTPCAFVLRFDPLRDVKVAGRSASACWLHRRPSRRLAPLPNGADSPDQRWENRSDCLDLGRQLLRAPPTPRHKQTPCLAPVLVLLVSDERHSFTLSECGPPSALPGRFPASGTFTALPPHSWTQQGRPGRSAIQPERSDPPCRMPLKRSVRYEQLPSGSKHVSVCSASKCLPHQPRVLGPRRVV